MPSTPWTEHLDKFRASHPGKTLKEAMVEASACYKGSGGKKVTKKTGTMHSDPLVMLTMLASHKKNPGIHLMTADKKHYIRYIDRNTLVINRDDRLPLTSAQRALFFIIDDPKIPECMIEGPDAHTTAQGTLFVLQSLNRNGFELDVRDGSDAQ